MKIAVMGYGTIGSGVVEILDVNKDVVAGRAGEVIEVAKVLDLRDFPGSPIENKLVRDYMDIVNDPEIGAVVETMGGVEPAYTFVKAMLEAGKSVTTSNKALVAAKGAELLRIAKERGVNFLFGASVGGGIPILRPIRTCLTAEVVEEITGIVNGTTNYMLTRMRDEGMEFDTVLKAAQDLGYAEKDPTNDIEGFDASRKIAILTSLITEQQVDFEDIRVEGITKISPADMLYAKALGRGIKLLATSTKTGDTYSAIVAPFMVPQGHPLYSVDGVYNAVFVHGNMVDDLMFYGSGAGKLPTASAVVADLVDIAKHTDEDLNVKWNPEKLVLADSTKAERAFFFRTADGAKALSVFADAKTVDGVAEGEVGVVTALMTEADFYEKVKAVDVIGNPIRLR